MFESVKDLWTKVETAGDTSVLLGAGVVGFVVDVAFDLLHSEQPSTIATLSAAGALSVKKAWDARTQRRRIRAVEADAEAKRRGAPQRAEKLQDFFRANGYQEGADRVEAHLAFRRLDISSDEQLDQACDAIRKSYLAQLGSKKVPPPPRLQDR